MNIDELTIKQIREIQAMGVLAGDAPVCDSPFKVGDKILHRSVTFIHVGRIRQMGTFPLPWILLEEGGWVAETAQFSQTLATGDLSEFEKAPKPFLIFLGASVDIWPWTADLPTETK